MPLSKLYRLVIVLSLLWLLLSGIYTPMLLTLGVLSIVVVCYLALRMQVLEHDGQPIYFSLSNLIVYWLWLAVEMVKSSWVVSRRILSPSLPIKPILTSIEAAQKTQLGQVIYANSITLTPGTVAVGITENNGILVHALHEDSVHELKDNMMAKKVIRVEPDKKSQTDKEGNESL